ncbi:hypothetical protein J7L09_00535 [bacterium]|nr:hypothetical protein [bacterium]
MFESLFLIDFENLLIELFIGICCALASYFIARNKQLSKTDIFYATFWFAGALWWIFNGLALGAWKIFPNFARTIIFFGGVWLGIHYVFGLIYIFHKIVSSRIVTFVSAVIGIIIFLLYYFGFLMKIKEITGRKEVYYNVSENLPHGYIFGGIMFAFIFGLILILLRDYKRGKFSLYNLSNFYSFYALIVYSAISLPSILYIGAGRLMNIFYLFVPYLIYLGYKRAKD